MAPRCQCRSARVHSRGFHDVSSRTTSATSLVRLGDVGGRRCLPVIFDGTLIIYMRRTTFHNGRGVSGRILGGLAKPDKSGGPVEPDLTECGHLDQIREVTPSADGCEDCLRTGSQWVHLRLCLSCGHVGCCDQSSGRHATGHWKATSHPIIRSFERGEDWAWCFEDDLVLEPA
jgi:hypothetical protein